MSSFCLEESSWNCSRIKTTSSSSPKSVREQLDCTKENYVGALRELRHDRISWKAEKKELRDLKNRVRASNSSSNNKNDSHTQQHKQQQHRQQPQAPAIPKELEIKHLMKKKKRHESHLNHCADQIQDLKEMVVTLRHENQGLRGQLDSFKANHHQATVIGDLEDEVAKWEALYMESAELGAKRMNYLEQELTALRSASARNVATSSSSISTNYSTKKQQQQQQQQKEMDDNASMARKQIDTLYEKLKTTFASAKARKQKLKQYKQKTKQRVSLLKEMLDQAKKEKEIELLQVKAQQEDEISLLDTIDQLETQLCEQGDVLERERAAAAKREQELTVQLQAARKLAYLEEPGEDNVAYGKTDQIQDFCSVFAKKIGERLCGSCGCLYDDSEAEKRRVYNSVPVLQ